MYIYQKCKHFVTLVNFDVACVKGGAIFPSTYLSILSLEISIEWSDLAIPWNDLTSNDVTIERTDRRPLSTLIQQ